jgi:phenylalanyl-tRNA synthetase beta chain
LDLAREVDLYEELARLSGYDRLPATLPQVRIGSPAGDGDAYRRAQSVRCLAASLGLTEAITWSLVSEAALTRCGLPADAAVRLANPLSQDHAFVRPGLLPGLLQAVRHNLSHGASQVSLFEVGTVMTTGAREEMRLGIALAGWWQRDWRKAEKADFWIL